MKRLYKMCICVLLVIVLSIQVAAHSSTQRYAIDSENPPSKVGTEEIGWSIDETCHTNGSSSTYYFRTGTFELSDVLKNVFRSAASMWSSIVTFTESSSQGGEITAVSNAIYRAAAEFVPISIDSSGHITNWTIQINTHWYDTGEDTISQYSTYMAHELGHVIGLNDLSSSANYNKIMCGSADDITATTPRTADLNGARVITGAHSTHTWSKTTAKHSCSGCGGYGTHSPDNSRCTYTSNGASTHTVYCSICNYTFTESHSAYYNSLTGECSACGYEGLIQMGMEDIEK